MFTWAGKWKWGVAASSTGILLREMAVVAVAQLCKYTENCSTVHLRQVTFYSTETICLSWGFFLFVFVFVFLSLVSLLFCSGHARKPSVL